MIKIRFSILPIFGLVLLSCNTQHKEYESNPKEIRESIEYSIEFPDTVFPNQVNDGTIYFKSTLDAIITTFGDKRKHRYARFIITTTQNVDYDFKQLKLAVKDTFGALNNKEIPFYDIKFPKEGVYYIDGIINDIVLLDTIKNSKPDDKIELVQNEVRVTHKVTVLSKQ